MKKRKKLTDKQKATLFLFLSIATLFIGIVIGYMTALGGLMELLSHVNIGNVEVIIDLNQTEMVEQMACIINNTYC